MPAKPAPEEHHLTGQEIDALPVGSVVIDNEDDTYTRVNDGLNTLIHDSHGTHWDAGEVEGQYGPVRLVSTPVTDWYQEARLALRDVLGMEPDEQMIRNTMAAHRPQITTMHETAKRVTNVPKPAAPNLTAGFGIAVSGGGFAASATVDTDDTVNGLARLRAHSALDALLDQHGISR